MIKFNNHETLNKQINIWFYIPYIYSYNFMSDEKGVTISFSGLVSFLWHITLCALFNAKSILLEEQ